MTFRDNVSTMVHMSAAEKNDRIGFRENAEVKRKATIILESMGLDISTACQILLRQVINTGSFPLKMESGYSAEGEKLILASVRESEEERENDTEKSHSSVEELMNALDS